MYSSFISEIKNVNFIGRHLWIQIRVCKCDCEMLHENENFQRLLIMVVINVFSYKQKADILDISKCSI
ncbi:hypothetical protein L6452_34525 [Arctium lappa]|uniref:Uncharacterized protein n=1 Tax=Arctium lappa TaxID=4217 RepID=A0ACB8YK08_ARCLA|nr:hypothetical protein L6452_34525 [Arctium lappa]